MVDQALLQTLADGHWYNRQQWPATDRGDPAGLAVRVAALTELGLEVEYDADRGYRLVEPLRLLERNRILNALPGTLQESLQVFDLQLTVDSTNSAALRWLRSGGTGRGLFLAERQELGRGRRGRNWASPFAGNIYLSLAWPVGNSPSVLDGFSLVTALSLVAGLQTAGLSGTGKLQVKWPNDVWLDGAKLAGILLELNGSRVASRHVIIGMGVNVHMPESALQGITQPVTDLYTHGNVDVDRNAVVAAVLTSLEANLDTLANDGFSPFREHWHKLDALYHHPVEINDGRRVLSGVNAGVSETGALILKTDEGEQHFSGGEVAPSVRPLATGRHSL